MSLPEARLLEETFRAILATALGSTVALFTTNENIGDGEPRPLPAVGIFATRKGDNMNLTEAGRPASDMEVKLECRVDGTKADSSRAVEDLAERVRAAVLGAGAAAFADWDVVDAVEFTGTETGFDSGTRVLANLFSMVVMPAET